MSLCVLEQLVVFITIIACVFVFLKVFSDVPQATFDSMDKETEKLSEKVTIILNTSLLLVAFCRTKSLY